MFANVYKLGRAVITLPHSSANSERTFSQLNLVKNKTRNRLHVSSTSSLLSAKDYLKYNNVEQNVCHNTTQILLNKRKEKDLEDNLDQDMIFD